eukprot:656177-Prorocentrum_minimum.AAC.6
MSLSDTQKVWGSVVVSVESQWSLSDVSIDMALRRPRAQESGSVDSQQAENVFRDPEHWSKLSMSAHQVTSSAPSSLAWVPLRCYSVSPPTPRTPSCLGRRIARRRRSPPPCRPRPRHAPADLADLPIWIRMLTTCQDKQPTILRARHGHMAPCPCRAPTIIIRRIAWIPWTASRGGGGKSHQIKYPLPRTLHQPIQPIPCRGPRPPPLAPHQMRPWGV